MLPMDDDFTLLGNALAAHFKAHEAWQQQSRDKPFAEALGNLAALQRQFSETLDGLKLDTARGQYARCDLQKLLEMDVKATEQFAQDQRFEHSTLSDVYKSGKANEKGMASYVRLTLGGSLAKAQRMSEPEARARMELECTTHSALAVAAVGDEALMALVPMAVISPVVETSASKTRK